MIELLGRGDFPPGALERAEDLLRRVERSKRDFVGVSHGEIVPAVAQVTLDDEKMRILHEFSSFMPAGPGESKRIGYLAHIAVML